MSIIRFNDPDTERYVLACLLKFGAKGWQEVPDAWFKEDICRKTYRELKQFLKPPYQTFPTVDIVVSKTEDLDIKLFVKELESMNVDLAALRIKIYDLFEMYSTRKVFEVAEAIPNDLESHKVSEVIRSRIVELADLVNPLEVGMRERGFIYENARKRWENYERMEQAPETREVYSTGIADLDRYTNGGIRKSHIVMLYAETGGFKTKVKANLAYNFGFQDGLDVMVVTLEVPKEDYEIILDSRHAQLSYSDIISGNLGEERLRYREKLVDMANTKPSVYIVDIPGDATSVDIIREFEMYYTRFGKYPDVLVLDYLNEMSPVDPWGNTSEKFKNLGVEIRRLTRMYKCGFVGSMQENREGKKIKDKSKIDLEHIGESHYFSNVCHLVIHLYQDAEGIDEVQNVLHWGIKKNRYGPKHVSFSTFCNPVINYVGDWQIAA
jgi:replicative DNA helicase